MDSRRVTGFRSWRVIDGRLRSPFQEVFWDEPTVRAHCRDWTRWLDGIHLAPDPSCRCGIYVQPGPNLDLPKVDYRAVTGIVTAWGRVEIHEDGIRAEHARIEALAPYSRSSSRLKTAVSSIADELGVDVIDLDDIEAAAVDYGRLLQTSTRA